MVDLLTQLRFSVGSQGLNDTLRLGWAPGAALGAPQLQAVGVQLTACAVASLGAGGPIAWRQEEQEVEGAF